MVSIALWCLSCSDDGIPDECFDRGYNENPESFDENFYFKGILNGKEWEAKNGVFYFVDDSGFNFTVHNTNSCGLDELTFYSYSNISKYSFVQINIDPPIKAIFNYGGLNEYVFSQEYDSLVVSQEFDNFLIFDHVTPDTSIVEGRFQLHLTKRWCKEFDNGRLEGCDTPPDYIDGEPKDIIVTDGQFRLKRNE